MTKPDPRSRSYASPHTAPMPPGIRARLDALIARLPDEPEDQVHLDLVTELRAIVGGAGASSMLPLFVPELGWTFDYAHIHHPTRVVEDGRAFMTSVLAGVGRDDLSPVFPMTDAHANRPLYCSRQDVAEWSEFHYGAASRGGGIPEPQVALALMDQSTMLGYVGFATDTDEFAPWAATALVAIAPALRARLAVDLRIREARLLTAALEAALDFLEVPAFVLLDSRHVVHANALGKLWRDRDPEGLRSAIDASIEGAPGAPLAVDRRRIPGLPEVIVAVQRRARSGARLAQLAREHGLTPRETQVLEQVACGHANKTIAANLECSVKNVEAMITSLLRKSRCASRSEILARLAAER